MKNSKSKVILFLITFIFFTLGVVGICIGKSNTYNLVNSNILEKVKFSNSIEKNTIIQNVSIDFDIRAKYNNLGGIQFLFDNVGGNPTILDFCIKEESQSNWNCNQSFDLSNYDTKNFYIFGIPPITDSKGKTYQIKISVNNETAEGLATLSSDSNNYYLVYNYPLSYLNNNRSFIPTFIIQKLYNSIQLINFSDVIFLLIWLTLSLFIAKSIINSILKANFNIWFKNFSKHIKDKIGLLALIAIYIISHVPFLTYSQYWDATFYFNSIVGSAEKLLDFVHFTDNFNIYGHPSMGYASLMSISQVVSNNNNVYLLNIENVILAVFAIIAFYNIFLFFFKKRKIEALLLTTIFAFNPLFYATSISLNLDFPILVFFVLMLNSLIHKRYTPFAFWAVLLVFSKETGLLVYLSFVVAYFLLITLKRIIRKEIKIDISKILYFLFPLILFVLYLSSNNWELWSNQGSTGVTKSSSFVWNDSGNFGFGINSSNIFSRTVQMFIMNFSWIVSLLIITAFIKSQVLSEGMFKRINPLKIDLLRVISTTFLVFVVFNFVYIVMPFARYTVFSVFPFLVLGYIAIDYLFSNKRLIRIILLSVIVTLCCIQTFKDIDPSVKLLYGKKVMGKNISSPYYGMADGLVYNAQFAYFDTLANLVMNETRGAYLVRDNANVYFFKDISYGVGVDNIRSIQNNNYPNIIFVHFPWFSNVDDDLVKLRKYYNVSYIKSLEVAGYSVELYRLE